MAYVYIYYDSFCSILRNSDLLNEIKQKPERPRPGTGTGTGTGTRSHKLFESDC